MIEAGATAPDFTLCDQDGAPVALSGLRGRPVVLYFYPKAERNASKRSRGSTPSS
jgi:peroxiredoxin